MARIDDIGYDARGWPTNLDETQDVITNYTELIK